MCVCVLCIAVTTLVIIIVIIIYLCFCIYVVFIFNATVVSNVEISKVLSKIYVLCRWTIHWFILKEVLDARSVLDNSDNGIDYGS